ncbi:unannotated protein [freshwater metagenome]|uniref:dITP/XTP pyrophosphatase n=1 Tax=freshwater metagenome TaxID=449393 RepID=A0A6J7GN26_9ZZZZ
MNERAPIRLVCATANAHKVTEIAAVLGDAVELVARPDEVPEVIEHADTLEGNARLKAFALCEATGLAAVADDTGLEVDALDGAPGVRSARFAGDEADDRANVAKLLEVLRAVPNAARTARFRTVALVCWPDGHETIASGTAEGRIAPQRLGHEGFGYDPVFIPDDGDGRSFAEMVAGEKNAISHRGRAFRALAAKLYDER